MNVRVLLILLLVNVILAFMPRFRRIGLVSCALLLTLLVWVNVHEAQQPKEPEPTLAKSSSSSAATNAQPRANIIAIQLDGRGAPWRLSGSVQNVSGRLISSLRLNIERYDCATATTAFADCSLMWQGEHIARLTIASGATSKLDESFYSHVAVPLQKGVIRDRIVITSTN